MKHYQISNSSSSIPQIHSAFAHIVDPVAAVNRFWRMQGSLIQEDALADQLKLQIKVEGEHCRWQTRDGISGLAPASCGSDLESARIWALTHIRRLDPEATEKAVTKGFSQCGSAEMVACTWQLGSQGAASGPELQLVDFRPSGEVVRMNFAAGDHWPQSAQVLVPDTWGEYMQDEAQNFTLIHDGKKLKSVTGNSPVSGEMLLALEERGFDLGDYSCMACASDTKQVVASSFDPSVFHAFTNIQDPLLVARCHFLGMSASELEETARRDLDLTVDHHGQWKSIDAYGHVPPEFREDRFEGLAWALTHLYRRSNDELICRETNSAGQLLELLWQPQEEHPSLLWKHCVVEDRMKPEHLEWNAGVLQRDDHSDAALQLINRLGLSAPASPGASISFSECNEETTEGEEEEETLKI